MCIFICIFILCACLPATPAYVHDGGVQAIRADDGLGPPVSEQHLTDNQERARGLVLFRLQQIWDVVEPHLNGKIQEEGLRPDPRMVETGIRVLDRVTKLYRLLEPPAPPEPEDPSLAVSADRMAVEASLRELEARMGAEHG
jgi:hypothetical protein